MNVERLEGRVVPAMVIWQGTTGGSWTDTTRWSTGSLPTANDDVMVTLASGQTLLISTSVTTQIDNLMTFGGTLEVDGSLTLTGASTVGSALDIDGSVTVAVLNAVPNVSPGNELSLLPYLTGMGGLHVMGSTDITGTLTTVATSKTVFGFSTVHVAGSGSLAGAGWFSVAGGTLTIDGDETTLARLYAGANSMINGTADLTITSAFIAHGTTIAGTTASVLTNQGHAFIVAGGLGNPNQSSRNITNLAGATMKLDGELKLSGGAVFTNLGKLEVTGNSTIRAGAGSGTIQNKGEWIVTSPSFTAEVPFVNQAELIADNPPTGGNRVVVLRDFTQLGGGAAAPSVSLNYGAELHLGRATIATGEIVAAPPEGKQLRGAVVIDSTLTASGSAEVTFSAGASEVTLSQIVLFADSNSKVVLSPAPQPVAGVSFSNCEIELNGLTQWLSGSVAAHNSKITNYGQFDIQLGYSFDMGFLGEFVNFGLFQKSVTDPAPGAVTFFSSHFTNKPSGSIIVGAGKLQMTNGIGSAFAGTVTISPSATLAFVTPGTVNYTAMTHTTAGGNFIFYTGTTRLDTGAVFVGDGTVSIQGAAVWEVPDGRTVDVSNLALTPSDITDTGFGTIRGLRDPSQPWLPPGQIRVGTTATLTSFLVDSATLTISPTATGVLAPIGDPGMSANFRHSLFRIGGTVTWSGDDVTLTGETLIWVGGTPAAPASFFLDTNSTMKQGVGETIPQLSVAPNGVLDRAWTAEPGTTKFQVVEVIDAGGFIDWDDLEFIP